MDFYLFIVRNIYKRMLSLTYSYIYVYRCYAASLDHNRKVPHLLIEKKNLN